MNLCVFYPCVNNIIFTYVFITDCSSNAAISENKIPQFTGTGNTGHTVINPQKIKNISNEYFTTNNK